MIRFEVREEEQNQNQEILLVDHLKVKMIATSGNWIWAKRLCIVDSEKLLVYLESAPHLTAVGQNAVTKVAFPLCKEPKNKRQIKVNLSQADIQNDLEQTQKLLQDGSIVDTLQTNEKIELKSEFTFSDDAKNLESNTVYICTNNKVHLLVQFNSQDQMAEWKAKIQP